MKIMADSNATERQAFVQFHFSLDDQNNNKNSMLCQIVPVTDLAELCVTGNSDLRSLPSDLCSLCSDLRPLTYAETTPTGCTRYFTACHGQRD